MHTQGRQQWKKIDKLQEGVHGDREPWWEVTAVPELELMVRIVW